jgi:hypothetical protein
MRRCYGIADVRGGGEGNPAGSLLGGGVDDVEPTTCTVAPFAGDEEAGLSCCAAYQSVVDNLNGHSSLR